MDENKRKWAGKTGGTGFGQAFLLFLLRYSSVRVGYFLMAFSIPVYLVIHPNERKAIYRYFRDRQNFSAFKSALMTIRNHYVFGKIVMDKFAVLAGRKEQFRLTVDGDECFRKLVARESGFVMVSAHIGNFELAGYALSQNEKKIYTMYYAGEGEALQQHRQRRMNVNNVEMVPVLGDMSHLFLLNSALDEGNIVSMTGDRVWGSDKTFECAFFHSQARFPMGPFRLAAIKEVPVVALFAMKERGLNYRIYVKSLTADCSRKMPAAKRAKLLADDFAAMLEDMVRKYPEQWFNFYDFWESSFND